MRTNTVRVSTSVFSDSGSPEPIAAADVLEGSPATATRALWSEPGPVESGTWLITPGMSRDTEVQEIFVVLAGRATITINDGEPRAVTTGDIVSFQEGDETVWQVHETLRKFYVIRTSTDME